MSSLPEEGRRVSLVLGGARSGKSHFAEELARTRVHGGNVLYVATLEPYDEEMAQRVQRHKSARPSSWRTLEAPYELAGTISSGHKDEQIVLLDCLTLWASNLLLREDWAEGRAPGADLETDSAPRPEKRKGPPPDFEALEKRMLEELTGLVGWARQKSLGLILVSNEVGLSLVPPYPLGRVYQDMLGRLNQHVATLSDEVFMCFAGIPVELKQLQYRPL